MSAMVVQYIIVGVIVAIALVSVGRRVASALKGRSGCSQGCSCGKISDFSKSAKKRRK